MSFEVKTKGRYDFIDITEQVAAAVRQTGLTAGTALVFVKGSTAAVTTMEFESGLERDIVELLEKLAPEAADYHHNRRWGDRNGAAHIKSALIGTDLCVPVEDGSLKLGTWQQIVLIDFDERPRTREVSVTVTSGQTA